MILLYKTALGMLPTTWVKMSYNWESGLRPTNWLLIYQNESILRLDQKVYQTWEKHLAKKIQTKNLPLFEFSFGQNVNISWVCKVFHKKLNMFCGLIYKIRHMYQPNFLLQFFHAYVTSVIKHGLLNYGSTRKTLSESINKAQRRIIRAFFLENHKILFEKI